MRFTRLRLTGWRNFRSVQAPLGPRVLLFGPNGSGKTNLLDALRFVADVARPDGGLLRAVTARDGRFLRSSFAPPGADFKVEIEADIEGERWGYALGVSLDKQGQPRVRTEAVNHERQRPVRRPGADDRREPLRLSQTHLEQASTNTSLQPLIGFLTSVRSVRGPVDRGALGASLGALPKRQRDARMRRLVELGRRVLPRLDRMAFEPDELGVPRLLLRFERGKAAAWYRDEQLSDGVLRLLTLLLEADGKGPLLLEEPEAGLHPEALAPLLSTLAEGGRQLLVSTHAERLLDDAQPDEILLLNPTSEGTHVELAADDTRIQAAVEATEPLGPVVAARTGLAAADQMPLLFDPER